jgi:hypothetical protein
MGATDIAEALGGRPCELLQGALRVAGGQQLGEKHATPGSCWTVSTAAMPTARVKVRDIARIRAYIEIRPSRVPPAPRPCGGLSERDGTTHRAARSVGEELATPGRPVWAPVYSTPTSVVTTQYPPIISRVTKQAAIALTSIR